MEEIIKLTGISSALSTVIVGIIIYFGRNYFTENIKNSIKNEYEKKLASHKSQLDKELYTLQSNLKAIDLQKEDKWNLKRETCLETLQLADNVLSNMEWSGINSDIMIKGEVKTVDGRKTYNKLATCCDSEKVLKLMKSILLGENEKRRSNKFGNNCRL